MLPARRTQPTGQCLDGGIELSWSGRLGDVDVCAAGIAASNVLHLIACCHHDDAEIRLGGTHSARYAQAVLSRQVEVEQHDVSVKAAEIVVKILSGGDALHFRPEFDEGSDRRFAQVVVILYSDDV